MWIICWLVNISIFMKIIMIWKTVTWRMKNYWWLTMILFKTISFFNSYSMVFLMKIMKINNLLKKIRKLFFLWISNICNVFLNNFTTNIWINKNIHKIFNHSHFITSLSRINSRFFINPNLNLIFMINFFPYHLIIKSIKAISINNSVKTRNNTFTITFSIWNSLNRFSIYC